MIVASTYDYFLSLPILSSFALSKQLGSLWFGAPNPRSSKVWVKLTLRTPFRMWAQCCCTRPAIGLGARQHPAQLAQGLGGSAVKCSVSPEVQRPTKSCFSCSSRGEQLSGQDGRVLLPSPNGLWHSSCGCLSKAANSTPTFHWEFRFHWVCWVTWTTWQGSWHGSLPKWLSAATWCLLPQDRIIPLRVSSPVQWAEVYVSGPSPDGWVGPKWQIHSTIPVSLSF